MRQSPVVCGGDPAALSRAGNLLHALSSTVHGCGDTAVMTEVLSSSTGMTNSSQAKIAQYILSSQFDSGFRLDLMCKDPGIAMAVGQEARPRADGRRAHQRVALLGRVNYRSVRCKTPASAAGDAGGSLSCRNDCPFRLDGITHLRARGPSRPDWSFALKDLNIAIIGGGGFMGRAHSLSWSLADIAAELGAKTRKALLVDATPELAQAAAGRLGWTQSSASWQEAVARPDIDIIDICTPPDLHEQIALAAFAHGKHVFCEKPITNDAAAATRMAQAAAQAGVAAQVGFNYRHTPAITYAKQLLDTGVLGIPLQFRGSYTQGVGFTADPNRWRARGATGGSGMVGDIGSHIIDIAEHLFGPISRVCALIRAKGAAGDAGWLPEQVRLDEQHLDDAAAWVAEFANGAIGSFAISAFAPGRMNRIWFEFDASKAGVEFDWNRREEFRVAYRDEPRDHQGFRTIHTNQEHPDGWWRLAGLGTGYLDVTAIQFQHFLRAVTGDEAPAPSFETGAQVQSVVEAVRRSAHEGGWVSLAGKLEARA